MFDFKFNSIDDFIYMDGHGIFVWSVFALFVLSLLIFFRYFMQTLKKIQKRLNNNENNP